MTTSRSRFRTTVWTSRSATCHQPPPDRRAEGAGHRPDQGAGVLGETRSARLAGGCRPERRAARHAALAAAGSPEAGITADNEHIHGDRNHDLRFDPAGLPTSVVEKYPYAAGLPGAGLDGSTADGQEVARGPGRRRRSTSDGSAGYGTGPARRPRWCSTTCIRKQATKRAYGIVWRGDRGTFRLWAPTAQGSGCWSGRPAPRRTRRSRPRARTTMTERSDGSWAGRPAGRCAARAYLYEVKVFAPSTQRSRRTWSPIRTRSRSPRTPPARSRSIWTDAAYQPSAWRTTPCAAASAGRGLDDLRAARPRLLGQRPRRCRPSTAGPIWPSPTPTATDAKHLQALATAGLNTVHLLPTFDIASIPETGRAAGRRPAICRPTRRTRQSSRRA